MLFRSEVENNIQRFKQLQQQHRNIQLQCCTTVNVFNIRYINDVANWIVKQGFDFVYWNMMHDAWYFSIACLPDRAKHALTQYLNTVDIPPEFEEEFTKIINFMNRGASTDGFMTRMKIADLDRKRNSNFAVTCPEMAELLEYTGP